MTTYRGFWVGGVVLCCLVRTGEAQSKPYYFYQGRTFGSEATFNPVTKLLQGGFYILDTDNRSNNPFVIKYEVGLRNVAWNLFHPFDAIQDFGWNRFLSTEVFPNPRRRTAQWVPNYFGHILGEGMTFRATEEWYRYHGYRYETALALTTTLLETLLNEVVENGAYRGTNVDPIADVYLFNPLGILLFRSDKVAAFFSRTLHMAYWPRQLMLDPFSGTLENVGHDFVFKYPVSRSLALFASYGTHSLAGLTFRQTPSYSLSIAAGVMAKELVDAAPGLPSRSLTATIVPAIGFYYDRENSLLFSTVLAPRKDDKMSINVYPGVFRVGGISPGIAVAFGGLRGLSLGVDLRGVPLGVAAHIR